MARGGERPGAGRKPGSKNSNVLAMPGRPGSVDTGKPMLNEGDRQALLVPPSTLTADEQAVWKEWAPRALAELTLSPATAAGFQKFCVLWAIAKRIEAKMALLGVDTKDGSPYLKDYIALTPKLDSAMRCFKLTAFGKPAISEKPKPAANPWAGVIQK